MSVTDKMRDDIETSLQELHKASRHSLVKQILQIQGCAISHDKHEDWANHLRFLRIPDLQVSEPKPNFDRFSNATFKSGHCAPSGKTLLRTHWSENPYERQYVAISYPWLASAGEDSSSGGYLIKAGTSQRKNKVRDIVIYRALRYARAHGARLIWIDQESIDQDNPQDKAIGVQSMDMVYSRSAWPLALLTVQIKTMEELDLLEELLHGKLFHRNQHSQRFTRSVDKYKVKKVEDLIVSITSDRWWKRAWIFQEEYKASGRMCLLIPLRRSVNKHGRFGDIPGELEINSAEFRSAVSRFIKACTSFRYQC